MYSNTLYRAVFIRFNDLSHVNHMFQCNITIYNIYLSHIKSCIQCNITITISTLVISNQAKPCEKPMESAFNGGLVH